MLREKGRGGIVCVVQSMCLGLRARALAPLVFAMCSHELAGREAYTRAVESLS